MALDKTKLIPTVCWAGFLALGFVTSVGSPGKHRVIDQAMARNTRTAAAPVVSQTEPAATALPINPARY